MITFKILPRNYLADWGEFESWALGVGSAPDGWLAATSPFLIASDATNLKYGTRGLMIVGSNGGIGGVYRTIPNGSDYAGRTFKLGLWAKSASTGPYFEIHDGVTSSTVHLDGSNAFVEMTSPAHKLDVDATQIKISLFASANATAWFDSAILCEGPSLFTTFSGQIDPANFQPNLQMRQDRYEVSQREGSLIPESHIQSKNLRLSGQVVGSDADSTRNHFDTFIKSLISWRKNEQRELYIFDNRVAEVYLSNLANDYVNPLNMMRYTMNLVNQKGTERYIAKLRNRQVIAATVTEFNFSYGGSDESFPIVSFVADQGVTITTCTLKNLTTGESFSYTGTVPSGVALDIDCDLGTVLNSSVNKIADWTGDFLKVVVGTNYFEFSGSNCTINIDYFERFLSE